MTKPVSRAPGDYPQDRLDQLRAFASEHACVGVAVDLGGRYVLVDEIKTLPGDRILLVEEASLWEEAAQCRVLTVKGMCGVRVLPSGKATGWKVLTDCEATRKASRREVAPINELDVFLTVPEALERFALSRSTFYKLLRTTDLEDVVVRIPPPNGRIRVPGRQFEEWLRKRA